MTRKKLTVAEIELQADLAEMEELEDISDEEWGRLEGASHGSEFRRKELAYDRRGGLHELTDSRTCCYLYMSRLARLRRFEELRAPSKLIEETQKKIDKMAPYITPAVDKLVAANWDEFWRDFRIDGAVTIMERGWPQRFGVVPHKSLN